MRYDIIIKDVEIYRKGDYMIRREKYLQQLIANRDNGFPKIITGIRRCGKSFLMKEIFREYLLSDGMKEDDILSLSWMMTGTSDIGIHSILENMSGSIVTVDQNMSYFLMRFRWSIQSSIPI